MQQLYNYFWHKEQLVHNIGQLVSRFPLICLATYSTDSSIDMHIIINNHVP